MTHFNESAAPNLGAMMLDICRGETNALTVSPAVAEGAASTRTEAQIRAGRIADTLKSIARAPGDVYLNISTVGLKDFERCTERNPAFPRCIDMFSGPAAERQAFSDAHLERGEPMPGHITTIVLHPDGTWSEQYLFRL